MVHTKNAALSGWYQGLYFLDNWDQGLESQRLPNCLNYAIVYNYVFN